MIKRLRGWLAGRIIVEHHKCPNCGNHHPGIPLSVRAKSNLDAGKPVTVHCEACRVLFEARKSNDGHIDVRAISRIF